MSKIADTDPVLYAAGGNPYGTSYPSGVDDSSVSGEALTAAHYQGHRLAQYANRLVAGTTGSPQRPNGGSSDPLALAPYDPPAYYRQLSP